MKDMNIAKFLKEEKSGAFHLGCTLPLGYVAGLPTVGVVAGKPYLKVPFLKYKVTGEVDKTLVFPVRYVLTYSLPDLKPIGFEDLAYHRAFRKVDFNKPIGLFRHEAVKNLSKDEYAKKRNELFAMYDSMINAMLHKTSYTGMGQFKQLFNMLIEPSVKPIYRALDKTFCDNFLA